MEATGQKVTKTAAQKLKDKNDSGAPKKPLGTYFIFLAHNREAIKKKHPDLSMCQQTKKISEEWKALSDDEKAKYTDLAAKDKERYAKQIEEFNTTGKFTPETKGDEGNEDEETEAAEAAE